MAFDADVRRAVDEYTRGHLPPEAWHLSYFDFIDDVHLARRLGEEFMSARVIYKMLEGLGADDWLQRAQVRSQILSYASIYEASIHHILFVNLAREADVLKLTEFPTKKQISIPTATMQLLERHLEHDGKKIIPTYEGVGQTEESKVRFDRKAECACALGLIEPWLKEELVEFYEARNSIHIHAEIKKSLNYELDLSKRAYMRLQPFKDQICRWQMERTD
ncbi:hypothetical protein ASG11_04290 [Sphingomonas sp. Leaf357]|uniref:hypothetical protein n=1 Tax=Sphingomonas sp. Leaf357 TaxID=1736350 RepID=UPI0006F4026C|nr:hypothetical protein [Sphingomonas sp. Leaf357]KQS03570.1 hypothetical protein ASG11_04290 [Sphingomonas sp. Leaf357]